MKNQSVVLSSQDLGIYIITYNRSLALRQTLQYILDSPIRNFPITVLDNCSSDDTVEVVSEFFASIKKLKLISNKYNIGLGANFLKVFELDNFKYTWVLCDDDKINNFDIDDILHVVNKGEVELIHVGAHPQDKWPFGGQVSSPKELLSAGYPYFKFSSFIPCNIFKTESFLKLMVAAYENVGNVYPHMPFLFNLYNSDKQLYISKNQIVAAQPSDTGYSPKRWFGWWMRTCELLQKGEDVRRAYLDQWKDIGNASDELGIKEFALSVKPILEYSDYVERFERLYFNENDKLLIRNYEKYRKGPFKIKVYLYEKLVTLGLVRAKK
jgi:glycosyltransferase involved in cell wall biosynthesis